MNRTISRLLTTLGLLFSTLPLLAAEPAGLDVVPHLLRSAIGVTRRGTAIECWLHREDLDLNTKKTQILLVGGLAGDPASVASVQAAVRWFYTSQSAEKLREQFILSAVPNANPDGRSGSGGDVTRGYPPPPDGCYNSVTNPEAAYLWRWIGMHAPDLVIDVRGQPSAAGDAFRLENERLRKLIEPLQPRLDRVFIDDLAVQLNRVPPSETGTIPAIKVVASDEPSLTALLSVVAESGWKEPSPARLELQRRVDRTAHQVAEQLSAKYGHALPEVAYIPAVALIGRLRNGELSKDERERTDVERIAAPYFQGEKVAKISAGNIQSGHLIFCELADRSTGERRARYVELARAAANQAFDDQGQPREAMPFHLEMSDSLFMGGPILAHVGALTGEARYFEACLRHLRFMRGLCLRSDGIYRHSPLDETAWGRGNGFPALGIALSLSKFPADHPGRSELLGWFRSHMQSLLAHQDPTGCWHQVVDHPESYRELTATCMIGFAMQHGVREGWLERDAYQPAIERAWSAIKTRVAENGRLVDVCTGTGKQKSLREYYDRPAILGIDDRGGAMALLFATEMARSP